MTSARSAGCQSGRSTWTTTELFRTLSIIISGTRHPPPTRFRSFKGSDADIRRLGRDLCSQPKRLEAGPMASEFQPGLPAHPRSSSYGPTSRQLVSWGSRERLSPRSWIRGNAPAARRESVAAVES